MRTLTFNRVVGNGAMGTVYHAELRVPGGFSRTCAVKIIASEGAEHVHLVTRMRDEARLLGMLNDEAILGVTDMLRVEGRDAVIMEYVDGADLWEATRDHPIPARALAELGAEVAGTLDRAHTAKHPRTKKSLDVIHRDVKPANIMVTTRGGVRLLDFGVARAAFAARESETQGLVLGTLNYFPPEILAGEEPTRAVDIYGLGLSLWECATGGEWGSPQVQRQRFEKRVRQRMSELGPDYAKLIPILERLIAFQAVERPSGQQAERLLAAVAEELPGKGLRAWAREAIAATQAARPPVPQSDPLVGRTIDVEASGPDEEATVMAAPLDELQTSFEPNPLAHPPPDPARTPTPPRPLGRHVAPRVNATPRPAPRALINPPPEKFRTDPGADPAETAPKKRAVSAPTEELAGPRSPQNKGVLVAAVAALVVGLGALAIVLAAILLALLVRG